MLLHMGGEWQRGDTLCCTLAVSYFLMSSNSAQTDAPQNTSLTRYICMQTGLQVWRRSLMRHRLVPYARRPLEAFLSSASASQTREYLTH